MLFFIALPLLLVANKFSSPVIDTLNIIINHIFRVFFASYVEYKNWYVVKKHFKKFTSILFQCSNKLKFNLEFSCF